MQLPEQEHRSRMPVVQVEHEARRTAEEELSDRRAEQGILGRVLCKRLTGGIMTVDRIAADFRMLEDKVRYPFDRVSGSELPYLTLRG